MMDNQSEMFKHLGLALALVQNKTLDLNKNVFLK